MVKLDMHVHSRFSKHPSHWVLQRLGASESYTEPSTVYQLAIDRGMTHVTITDHNTISGCLEIADRPGTFISEEVTTYLPADRCKVHVLTYGITESQHKEIARFRENMFDLVEYLQEESIFHALAHPLFPVNDRLTMDNFERLLLLFDVLELNGDQDARVNGAIRRIASSLTPETMNRLADKHGLAPRSADSHIKRFLAGSDDHSSLHIAKSCTESEESQDVSQFIAAIKAGEATINNPCSTPRAMAHAIYGITYQFYRDKLGIRPDREPDDFYMKSLDSFLIDMPSGSRPSKPSRILGAWSYFRRSRGNTAPGASLIDALKAEVSSVLSGDAAFVNLLRDTGERDGKENAWFHVVNRLSNATLCNFSNHVLGHFVKGNVFDLFHSIGSAGALYSVLAPYFLAFSLHGRHRTMADAAIERLIPEDVDPERTKVAHFTDTLHEINGVALTLRQQAKAAQNLRKDYRVVTCSVENATPLEGVDYFQPIGTFDLPEYKEMKLFYPPFLEMLDYCFSRDVTHVHTATPGPVGLAALAISRIMKVPIIGTYHTALPQYASRLTEEGLVEDLMWRFMVWYYGQLDIVCVPSQATGDELIERGIPAEKVRLFVRGINVERFCPENRSRILESRFGAPEGVTKMLYVGRISKEKNLPQLASVFRALSAQRKDLLLILVGDGPYLAEMKREMEGVPAIFTGYLSGRELDEVYASCEFFVFPSTTDTFGNVVLEAQASGLPVIVTDVGGPCENLLPGKTGIVCRGNDDKSLAEAIMALADDPGRVRAMGAAARDYMVERGFESAFEETWGIYGEASQVRRSRVRHEDSLGSSLLNVAGIARTAV